MLKLLVAVLCVAFAGSASAAQWKDLRIDGTSEDAFKQSLAAFHRELSPERRHVFSAALMDIWLRGTAQANADQTQYTVDDFHRQVHGLSYEQVVTFTDPSGKTAKEREREAKRMNGTVFSGPVQTPSPASQEQRLQDAHYSLDSGELMRARQGGTVERTGMPCRGTSAANCPGIGAAGTSQ